MAAVLETYIIMYLLRCSAFSHQYAAPKSVGYITFLFS
ncbi:hypothetical protein T10_6571 [Trichinella papuae]|uniref:Uncharacterized protein n=1 Tax=Trichinella papuae TaxID=268474 RepID=A0A0V1LY70_9BILA|nr:hypothetical protein T10_6571 [Trichinella papuae]